jgi:hypothetical protein
LCNVVDYLLALRRKLSHESSPVNLRWELKRVNQAGSRLYKRVAV